MHMTISEKYKLAKTTKDTHSTGSIIIVTLLQTQFLAFCRDNTLKKALKADKEAVAAHLQISLSFHLCLFLPLILKMKS